MEQNKNHQLNNQNPAIAFKNNNEGTLAIDLGSSTTVIVLFWLKLTCDNVLMQKNM